MDNDDGNRGCGRQQGRPECWERFPYGAVFRGSRLKKRIMQPTPAPGCRWRLLAASIAANSGHVQPMPAGRSDPT